MYSHLIRVIYQKPNTVVKRLIQMHLIPYVISENTLNGDHISEFKQRQIDKQYIEQNKYDDNQLKPAEGL